MKLLITYSFVFLLIGSVNAQKINDWQEKGLSGEVKYLKETSDELTQELFFSENGYLDSAAYARPNYSVQDAFDRNKEGWITERRYYMNDSLVAHFTFAYNDDYSEAVQTEVLQNSKAYLKFNNHGQESYRIVDLNGNGPDEWDMELYKFYDENGQMIEDRNVKQDGDLKIVNKLIYTYNLKGWAIGMAQENETDMAQTIVDYEFFNFNIDKKSNWVFCERRRPGGEEAMSIVREIAYYK